MGNQQRESYSSLTAHRSCPQRWQYGAIRGLSKDDPEDVRVELEFGLWWHALRAANVLERGRDKDSLRGVPAKLRAVDGVMIATDDLTYIEERVLIEARRWWESQTPYTQDVWQQRIGGGLVERLLYVYERWMERWSEEIAQEAPLAVEVFWQRELPPQPGVLPDASDPDTLLVGYVDEVYYDERRGIVVVRDNKASKALGTQTVADNMMDSQLQLYAWGLTPLVKEWGHSVRAVAYDRVRMSAPKTPKLNQSGTLSKSITDFDLHTYRTWAKGPDGLGQPYPGLKKDGSGAGFYTEDEQVVQNLSDPASQSAWFQRSLTPLSQNTVRTHLLSAVDSALDMRRTRARVELTSEAARNLGSACRWCDFAELCRAEMIGGAGGEYDLSSMRLRKRQ